MTLLIDIPKEFEQHFQSDRFDDSLHRLSADAHLLAGLYEQETAKMLIEAFKNAVPVPPHGDLIERKAAHDSILDGMVMTGYQSRALDCISEFYVPTIIPAEEGE